MQFKTDHLTRQMDIIPLSVLGEPITVVGAGAVGSITVLALAKMGFSNIQVFDNDKVSIENMNCQFYRYKDVRDSRLKVDALKEIVEEFANVSITPRREKCGPGQTFKGIVIAAVDSMAARKDIWSSHKNKLDTRLFIDPRMGAEMATMYVVNPCNTAQVAAYERTLHSDSDAVPERCTAKATMYTALALPSVIASTVKSFLTNKTYSHTLFWSIKDDEFKAFGRSGGIQ